jgi:hypothetical protein
MIPRKQKKNYFTLFKDNISVTTFCEWLFTNRPKSYSHHIYKFYNELSITKLFVWVLSGISWAVVYSVGYDPLVINRPTAIIITQHTILTVSILWLMFICFKWGCYVETAKFVGCFNIRKSKHGGVLWSERHEHYEKPIHLKKQLGVSLAIAMRSAVVPISFYLSLSLTLFIASFVPNLYSVKIIFWCPLIFFVLWLYWATIYVFIFKWMVEIILRYYIYKSHPDLKTDGYAVLWNVSLRAEPGAK